MESEDIRNKEIQNVHEIQIKKPKRILHCSDGVYEEYSDDDEEDEKKNQNSESANRSFLWKAGRSIINTLDYIGEGLGEILNITTPKYSYEISHFQREQEHRAKEESYEKENAWSDVERSQLSMTPVTQAPTKSDDERI